MIKKLFCSTLSASFLAATMSGCAPVAETGEVACAEVTEADIAALFDRWNSSLATLDPDQVVANYTPTAVLLPTVSNTPRTDHESIREYFVDFLPNNPQGVINSRTIAIGCNKAHDVGVYTFTFTDDQGQTTQEVARFSYVYVYKDGEWLIAHHHSSLMPETVAN
ncbi:SgcJ/EcaC family oxidoreductase [Limnospira fusiformis KN01]|uniref:SgcJ/EcaC family oxidoreductase n=1 Tax=Limnospira TaxID=2596745 RepID=UPI001658C358|nr:MULTISPECIES: SgcJ/EcaC family oxidoreductase [Limnospira]MDT9199465.1 SgcJ/EcaC family oxidoreductase [Limnospira sp. PMC 1042.18]ULB47675.1 SgcJ/EcaC family oxidoreductase [Limnospira fusiformis KN01]